MAQPHTSQVNLLKWLVNLSFKINCNTRFRYFLGFNIMFSSKINVMQNAVLPWIEHIGCLLLPFLKFSVKLFSSQIMILVMEDN